MTNSRRRVQWNLRNFHSQTKKLLKDEILYFNFIFQRENLVLGKICIRDLRAEIDLQLVVKKNKAPELVEN